MSAALQRETDALRQKIQALETKVRTPTTEADRNEIARAQSRADAVERAFGRNDASCLGHVPGESVLDYRRRLVRQYQQYSPRWRGARVEAIGNDTIGNVEEEVYHDAAKAARNPASYPKGTLHAVHEQDETGRTITKFVGDIGSWMAPFASAGASV